MDPFDAEEGPHDLSTLAYGVLIVDDEPVVLDVLTRLLARESDLLVTTASSGEEALGCLLAQRCDLLVTDKNLPGMTGLELISRARREAPGLEAMIITGYASAESVIGALAAGASDYLLKPFDDLQVVTAKLRSALERRRDRVHGRERARQIAREAAALLDNGHAASKQRWGELQERLGVYERSARESGRGTVMAFTDEGPLEALRAHGLDARPGNASSSMPAGVDVAVLGTELVDWRKRAEALGREGVDVVLLASPTSDLGELLEAISLRLDLVGFGGYHGDALVMKVRGLLQRRSVQRAQSELASALEAFREELSLASS